jgi:hypothetical protein
VTAQKMHYLDVGAAQVCDRAGLEITTVDTATESELKEFLAPDFNAELMQAALRTKVGARL